MCCPPGHPGPTTQGQHTPFKAPKASSWAARRARKQVGGLTCRTQRLDASTCEAVRHSWDAASGAPIAQGPPTQEAAGAHTSGWRARSQRPGPGDAPGWRARPARPPARRPARAAAAPARRRVPPPAPAFGSEGPELPYRMWALHPGRRRLLVDSTSTPDAQEWLYVCRLCEPELLQDGCCLPEGQPPLILQARRGQGCWMCAG